MALQLYIMQPGITRLHCIIRWLTDGGGTVVPEGFELFQAVAGEVTGSVVLGYEPRGG
jgi:hypothetical protein